MRIPFYASVAALALTVTVPAMGQQDPGSGSKSRPAARIAKPPASPSSGAYMGACGDWARCYTGIPLRCGDNTRPWQDVANHACFCVHDGCPQQ